MTPVNGHVHVSKVFGMWGDELTFIRVLVKPFLHIGKEICECPSVHDRAAGVTHSRDTFFPLHLSL